MKKSIALFLSTLFLTACAYVSVGDQPKPGYDQEFKELDDKTRKMLGLSRDDLLIAVTPTKRILYTARGRTFSKEDKDSSYVPSGRTLLNVIHIYHFKDSPNCWWYDGGRGYKGWYPRPDCPHPPR